MSILKIPKWKISAALIFVIGMLSGLQMLLSLITVIAITSLITVLSISAKSHYKIKYNKRGLHEQKKKAIKNNSIN